VDKRSTRSVARRRLFVGIALDAPTRAALVNASLAFERAGLRARFERAEKLHVTLAFLGSVGSERVAPLIAALRAGVTAIAPFTVRFDALGAFPNDRRARMVWAGARKPDAAFALLARAVRDAAREFARLDEKQAVLHVTLGRLREPARLPPHRLAAQSMLVDEIVLFESLPGEGTSRYEVVERFPLTVHASSPAAST